MRRFQPTYRVPAYRRPPVRSRLWLHALLLTATFVTLALAGGFFWETGFVLIPESVGLLTLPFWLVTHPGVAAEILVLGLPYACWVVAILGAHEMGHYLACRHYGIPATLPFFIPGPPIFGSFGAVIRIRGRIPTRKALFDLAAAGPIAGFVVALPVLLWGLHRAVPIEEGGPDPESLVLGQPILVSLLQPLMVGEAEHFYVDSVFVAAWLGILVTSLNLFPVGQLDGGHLGYAVSRRAHRWLSRLTIAGLGGWILFEFLGGEVPAYTLWFVILLWMRDRHPPLLDESTPLGAGRRVIAILLFLLFALCFIPSPLRFP